MFMCSFHLSVSTILNYKIFFQVRAEVLFAEQT